MATFLIYTCAAVTPVYPTFHMHAKKDLSEFSIGIVKEGKAQYFTLESLEDIFYIIKDEKKATLLIRCGGNPEKESLERFLVFGMPSLFKCGFKRVNIGYRSNGFDTDKNFPFLREEIAKAEKVQTEWKKVKFAEEEIRKKRQEEFKTCMHPAKEKNSAFGSWSLYFENENGDREIYEVLPIEEIKAKAETGDKTALFIYAYSMFADGPDGMGKNIEEGMKIMVSLAESGHICACNFLAKAYRGILLTSPFHRYGTVLRELSAYADAEKVKYYAKKAMSMGDFSHAEDYIMELVREKRWDEIDKTLYEDYREICRSDFHSNIALVNHYFGYEAKPDIMYDTLENFPILRGLTGAFERLYIVFSPPESRPPSITNPEKAYDAVMKYAEYAKDSYLLRIHVYLYGIGTEKNEKKAFETALSAFYLSEHIMYKSLYSAWLAYAYENGVGTEKNERMAELFWEYFYDSCGTLIYDKHLAMDNFENGFAFPKDAETAEKIRKAIMGR